MENMLGGIDRVGLVDLDYSVEVMSILQLLKDHAVLQDIVYGMPLSCMGSRYPVRWYKVRVIIP